MISRLLNVAKNEVGAAMVEFAIVLPLLLVVLLGIVQFAIFFYQYVIVENAAATGARVFVMNRPLACPSSATCPGTNSCPYTNTQSALETATAGLNWSSVTYSMSANGSSCGTNVSGSDSACGTKLCNAYFATGTFSSAQTGSVTVSYPCLTLLPASWAPSFCPNGNLTATNTQHVD